MKVAHRPEELEPRLRQLEWAITVSASAEELFQLGAAVRDAGAGIVVSVWTGA